MSYSTRNQKYVIQDPYTNIRHELKRETSVLLSDQNNRSGMDDGLPDVKNISRINTTYTSTTRKDNRQKIDGIINLAQNDKKDCDSEYRNVNSAEKEILDLLKQTGPERERKYPRGYQQNHENGSSIEEVRLRERKYQTNDDEPIRNAKDSRNFLSSENNFRNQDQEGETKVLRATSIPAGQRLSKIERTDDSQRVQDLIDQDFSVQDLEFLRGLSKDELIKRLIKALRMYKNEKSRRMWIENQLRRILGVTELPQNLEGIFGAKQSTISPIRKKTEDRPVRQMENDSVYGGMSQYTASPRKVPQRPNRSLNYDEVPITLETQTKSYRKEEDSKPLRGSYEDSVDTPTYRKIQYKYENKTGRQLDPQETKKNVEDRLAKYLASEKDQKKEEPKRQIKYFVAEKKEEPKRENRHGTERKEESSRQFKYASNPVIPEQTPIKRNYDYSCESELQSNPKRAQNQRVEREEPYNTNSSQEYDIKMSFNPERNNQGYRKQTESRQDNSSYQDSRNPELVHHTVSEKPDNASGIQKVNGSKKKLRRLHTIGGDHPGIYDLWEQGEAIRKETTVLISMKKEDKLQSSKHDAQSRKERSRPVYDEADEMKESYDDISEIPMEDKAQNRRKIQAITRATYN